MLWFYFLFSEMIPKSLQNLSTSFEMRATRIWDEIIFSVK